MSETPTWKELARTYPEFVQWVVQRYGPVPDGLINEADYTKYAIEYQGVMAEGSDRKDE
jgi:hypothetical protein